MSEAWTIGHWTCPEETFIGLLRAQRIEVVADVRSQPGSRASPQFGQESLRAWLDRAGIGYVHLAELGGRRPKQDVDADLNAGWRLASFRNYADYTLSASYADGIARLAGLLSAHRVAYMCAEPMPWRCHRLLISNTLAARGVIVRHITGRHAVQVHELGRWGAEPSVDADGRVTYPAPQDRDDAGPGDGRPR